MRSSILSPSNSCEELGLKCQLADADVAGGEMYGVRCVWCEMCMDWDSGAGVCEGGGEMGEGLSDGGGGGVVGEEGEGD